MVPTTDNVARRAAELLRVDDFPTLVESILARSRLGGNKFEAGEFGRNEHSTATAGVVLNGIGSLPFLSNEVRSDIAASVFSLVADDGTVVCHDGEATIGTTSWSLSQVLLGLWRFGGIHERESTAFRNGILRLVRCQTADHGWQLNDGDLVDPIFAVYPTLLFLRLSHDTQWTSFAQPILARTRAYLMTMFQPEAKATPLDKVLAMSLVERIDRVMPTRADQHSIAQQHKAGLIGSLMNSAGELTLRDQDVRNDIQPRWHSTTWVPPLYLFTRQWGGPLSPYNLLIGERLVNEFDPDCEAWHGLPGKRGAGRSWASSLALASTYRLAEDLVSEGVSYEKWEEHVKSSKRFDVVISFGGPDRSIAEVIKSRLLDAGHTVFYDQDYQHELLGEDLMIRLQEIYFSKSRYAIVILSESFLASNWAYNCEWRAVLERMLSQKEGYVLPYFTGDVIKVRGLNSTIGYISGKETSPMEFAEIVIKKLRSS
ncbi:toll/interleukin-1 receptor domain-containing protein [Arthrobacter sp. LAPM80]|uniref:TIR domain-containing protein n=1 Tax=Arthrobacter sp. LAPM80 TaxID=3141788 RepID=UPI00398B4B5F